MPSALPQADITRQAFGYVLMSAALPGSVQLVAGHRRLGRIAGWSFGVAAGLAVLVGVGLLVARGFTVGLLLTPAIASGLRVALWLYFIAWVGLLLDAWRLARPLGLKQRPRLGLTITALTLVCAMSWLTSTAANALVAAANVGEVFGGGGDGEAKGGRYNILLLGVDAAEGREGVRPDSVSVASVDAVTGRTVLFGLPRNLQRVPFPESSPLHGRYPDGYVCPRSECMLNGIYTLGEDHSGLYPGRRAGVEAMKEAVGETLGLQLNYYAMIDMGGFRSLIDAMGGIRLDVNKPIPVGGVSTQISRYIGPGKGLRLGGEDALWFARSRAESDDYERMARQKCVMAAMVAQLNPETVLNKFVELSEAGKNVVSTDVGPGEVTRLAELALKAKETRIASINFAPPLISTRRPDIEMIRATVRQRIDASRRGQAGSPAATRHPPAKARQRPTGKPSAATTQTEDLATVCSVS